MSPPQIPGYEWYKKSRNDKGGGVAIAVRNDIKSRTTQITNLEDHDQEILWIEITNGPNKTAIGTYQRWAQFNSELN